MNSGHVSCIVLLVSLAWAAFFSLAADAWRAERDELRARVVQLEAEAAAVGTGKGELKNGS